MSTAHIIAQLCMLATLILMITGKTPISLLWGRPFQH